MKATVAVLFASLCCAAIPARAAPEPLRLAGRTEMPGYTGDFDHFEYDLPSRRLWLAGYAIIERWNPIGVFMIRKLASGEFRLYSRKKNPKTGRRRNLGTFKSREAAEKHERAVQFFKRH